jgi:hypothetical protein
MLMRVSSKCAHQRGCPDVVTGHDVAIDGDRGQRGLGRQLLLTRGVITAGLARTGEGWKISDPENRRLANSEPFSRHINRTSERGIERI